MHLDTDVTNIEIEGEKSTQQAMEEDTTDDDMTPRDQVHATSDTTREQGDVPMQDENIAMIVKGATQQIKERRRED